MKSFFCSLILVLTATLAQAAFISSDDLAKLAIQEGGRKKPFTTFSRETLLALTGRTTFTPPGASESIDANEAILSMWLQPQKWENQAVILVDYRPLKQQLGFDIARKLFSYSELVSRGEFRRLFTEVQRQKAMNPQASLSRLQKEVNQVAQRLALYENVLNGTLEAVVPHPSSPTAQWLPITAIDHYYPGADGAKANQAFDTFRQSFEQADAARFSESVRNLSQQLRALSPQIYPSEKMLSLENFYQTARPFRWAWVAYALAAIVLGLTSSWYRAPGYKLGWTLILTGFGLQILGFACRIIIGGRAPVTNMYESVIWVAFGTVLFAIILEAIYRPRYFLLAAAPLAVLSLVLADTQPAVLDSSIHPLVPVLRNNFWLTIHVLTITLSYAAFALALGLGHIILGKTFAQTKKQEFPLLFTYLYRALQVGVLLLATGTILGGVWANYSWGRFWDWDPKETWALTALLTYLVLLHGRLVGWWGGFGLAVGAVLCFQSVLMAWYGVNFVLGTGLHSYGFGTGGFSYALAFVGAEIIFVILAVTRYRRITKSSAVAEAN